MDDGVGYDVNEMKKEHTGYALVERTQKGMLFFQDAKRKRT